VLRDQVLRWTLAANFNDMELGAVHTTPSLSGREDVYFGEREQAFLRASAPPVKITFGFDHEVGKLQTTVRLLHHGEVTLVDFLGTPDIYRPKQTLDLSATYRLSGRSTITVGTANVLNQYPTQQDTETESGGVWDAVQMGFSGAFYFAKLNVRF
jgi:iron complex outermembrane receptor protein